MVSWILLAQLCSVSAGQLSAVPPPQAAVAKPSKLSDDEGEAPRDARPRATFVPAPLPLLPPLPTPQVLALPAKPPVMDRVRTADGKVHVGHIVGQIDRGLEFEDEHGARYPIVLSAVVATEHGDQRWAAPVPQIPEIDADAARRALGLAFDIYALDQQRAALTYGEKALVLGLGVAATVLGFGVMKGDTGKAVGIVGAVGAGGGAIALGVNAVRSLSLSRRAEEARAQLKAIGQPALARGRTLELPVLAVKF